jgi:hypothetical protein
MAEIPTSSPEQFFDVTQAQHLLGYAVEPTPAHLLQPGMADERQAILDDALRAKETLRSDMVRAAKEGGIDVPESVIAGWEPNEAEVQLIRERLPQSRYSRYARGFRHGTHGTGRDAMGRRCSLR